MATFDESETLRQVVFVEDEEHAKLEVSHIEGVRLRYIDTIKEARQTNKLWREGLGKVVLAIKNDPEVVKAAYWHGIITVEECNLVLPLDVNNDMINE